MASNCKTPADAEKVPESHTEEENRYRVDRGVHAWTVIAGASVALFVQFGLGNSYGTFQEFYSTHQLKGYSSQQISWIGSTQLFLIFVFGTPFGRTFDAYGPRGLISAGATLLVLSLFLVSVFHQYYQLMICQGLIFGIGSSLIYIPCVSVMGQWFVKRRATASGIVAGGASLGGIVFPIMFSRMIDHIGFAWTVRTIAFVSMALFSFSIITVKARLPPRSGSSIHWLEPMKAFVTDTRYRLLVLSTFFVFWGLWIPFFYIGNFSESRGISTGRAFYALPVMNAGSLLGRMAGFIADKYGRFNLFTLATFFSGIIILAMWTTVTGHNAIFVFAGLFGIGSGVIIGLFPACTAQISPPELIGSRLGFLFFVMSFATLTGPPIAGALLAHGLADNQYLAPAAFSGAAVLVGGLCSTLARFSIKKDLWTVV